MNKDNIAFSIHITSVTALQHFAEYKVWLFFFSIFDSFDQNSRHGLSFDRIFLGVGTFKSH
jgi:hypothetical protein